MRIYVVTSMLFLGLLSLAGPRAMAGNGDRGTLPGLKPISLGRAVGLAPTTRGRAAGLRPVTTGRAATLPAISLGRKATLAPVTNDRAAPLKPVTTGRAAGLLPVSSGRAAGLSPVSLNRAASLKPVSAGLTPVSLGRAATLQSVSNGRAAGLLPVTTGRAAGLSTISLDRAATLRRVMSGEESDRVVAFRDGYLAPYGLSRRVGSGFFSQTLRVTQATPFGSAAYERRVTEAFRQKGLTAPYFCDGDFLTVLDTIDPYGPQHLFHRALGRNVPRGIQRGRFYFPAAFFIRPLSRRSCAYNKGWTAILVPPDITEVVPEDFDRTIRKSHFPLVIGDMSFKSGDYVQAALAFREAEDRHPDCAAAHFALGDALIALRNYGYAADEIRAGLALAPHWADELDRQGVYGVKGDLIKHLKQLEHFIAGQPVAARVYFLLGYIRMTSGDPAQRAKAASAFQKALDKDPNDSVSRRYRNLLARQSTRAPAKAASPEPAVAPKKAPSPPTSAAMAAK